MAKGRMINNAIAFDAKIHRLSCDTSRLAFTWLITFADVEGRTYGDPAVVRSMVFPRRTDVSIEDMGSYIAEWEAEKLVTVYDANGDTWMQFTNFDKNQKLRKDREAPSRIPAQPVRSKSGVSPEQSRVKAIEVKDIVKLKEEEGDDDNQPVGQFSSISTFFCNLSSIPELTGGAQKWNEAIGKWIDAGLEEDDLRAAYKILRQKKYTVTGPWSLTNTAISEMSKRLSPVETQEKELTGMAAVEEYRRVHGI